MSSATINDFLQAITASDSSKEELKEIYSSLVKFSDITSTNKEVRVFLTNEIHDSESKMSVIKDIIGDSTCSLNFFKTVLDFKLIYTDYLTYNFSARFDDDGAYADRHILQYKKNNIRIELGKNRPHIALKKK